MSRPVQVYLEDEDMLRLERWSSTRGWTKSQAVRIAVRAMTRLPDEDPLLAGSGMIDGLPRDLSRRIDAYLAKTFLAKAPTPQRGRAKTRGVRR